MNRYDCPILIVGAGPTGLTAALELARRGIRCRIIDTAPSPTKYSKAIGIQARKLELFEKIGVADRLVAEGHPMRGVSVFSHQQPIIQVDLARHIHSSYDYILLLPQNRIEQILIERLALYAVTVERNITLTDFTSREDGVEVSLRHMDGQEEQLVAGWLLGCDGAHSTVRHKLDLAFTGSAFEQDFALADVRLEGWNIPLDRASVFLQRGNLIAYFPLPEERFRLIIGYKSHTALDGEVTLAEVQRAIDACGPAGVRALDPVWLTRFHVNQRKVKFYSRGRVFLLGDAAHIHSPIGGQGMNTGIQDAFNLAWKLALVSAGQARRSLLTSYDTERNPVGSALLEATNRFTSIVLLHDPITVTARDTIASLVSPVEFVQQLAAGAVSELTINYRVSPYVQEYRQDIRGKLVELFPELTPHQPGIHAGDRAPDGQVSFLHKTESKRNNLHVVNGPVTEEYVPTITSTRLFDIYRSTLHILLIMPGQQPFSHRLRWQEIFNWMHRQYRGIIEAYVLLPGGVRLLEPVDIPGERILSDREGGLYKTFGIPTDGLVLVRPDGYIGLLSQSLSVKYLQEYLDNFSVK